MVRLWGGGLYEPDVFYDTCDGGSYLHFADILIDIYSLELGLLVWQDFQFACGVYPAHDSFVASVRKEAEQNVKRLRHHPAIALFCGNNEDYQMVLQLGGKLLILLDYMYLELILRAARCKRLARH
jgi:beta-mannosidase